MKDKISQLQQKMRRNALDNYFRERRNELIQYRREHSLDFG